MFGSTRTRRMTLGFGLVAALVTTSGCGQSTSGFTAGDEATVNGIVTIHGKKATHGVITFDASNSAHKQGGMMTAQIHKDGTYSVKTYPGQNYVVFSLPVSARDKAINQQRVSKEIEPGENKIDFAM